MFGSFLPGLGWLAPPKSIRVWEPTLLWNQFHSLPEGLSLPVRTTFTEDSGTLASWRAARKLTRLVPEEKPQAARVHVNLVHRKHEHCRKCPRPNRDTDSSTPGPIRHGGFDLRTRYHRKSCWCTAEG